MERLAQVGVLWIIKVADDEQVAGIRIRLFGRRVLPAHLSTQHVRATFRG